MSFYRTTEERRRDEVIRSINNLVRNCEGVNENLIPDELKAVLLKIRKDYPQGVSVRKGAEFGYLFIGGNADEKEGDPA